MKDIVILANFCRDFSRTDNGRFLYLCRELAKEHRVEIITSSFSHILKKPREPLQEPWPFRITLLPEPGYRRNISLQRFYSHWRWGREVRRYLRKRQKPDVIYASVPSLNGPLAAAKYCRKNGVRFIVDIQDLWPEAFQMVLNIPALFWPIRRQADGIYRRADEICAVSQTYIDRAVGVNASAAPGRVAFLGTDLSVFDHNVQLYTADVIQELALPPKDECWLAYCGSLSDSYDIGCVISALSILKTKGRKPPKFIVMGDGHLKERHMQSAASQGIDALFTGKLPYEKMCALLKMCDIAVNPIKSKSAASIINKHGDYAAAGLPVINTQESHEYQSLVEGYHMGFTCENGNPEELADKIELLMKDEALRKQMGCGARRCAEERFDRRHTYQKLIEAITQ